MAWRVGMKAICVNPGYWEQNPLVKGAVYTVLEIDGPYLGVDAYVTNGGNKWRARRFRPVVDRKTDISIFEEIRDGKRRVADEPVDADTLRDMERALADAGYMPPDRYVERNGK